MQRDVRPVIPSKAQRIFPEWVVGHDRMHEQLFGNALCEMSVNRCALILCHDCLRVFASPPRRVMADPANCHSDQSDQEVFMFEAYFLIGLVGVFSMTVMALFD